MTHTQARPGTTAVRNRFRARCRSCGRWAEPDGGFLCPKALGERWQVECDDCYWEAEERSRRAHEEWARRVREERERAGRAREEERRRREEADHRRWDRERAAIDEDYEALRARIEAAIAARIRQLGAPCLRRLGLTPPVAPDQIKAAYRRLAHETHPDKGGDARAFVELNSAYREALALFGGAAAGVRP